MDTTSQTERWVVCPVCHKPNPAGTVFCKHCWGAIIRTDRALTSQELEEVLRRRALYLKRRKTIKLTAGSFASLVVAAAIAFYSLYACTDLVFPPPKDVNSNSPPGEWTMFGHDLSHSGSTGPATASPQGKIKWVFPTGASIHSSPAVADGTVYFGSRDSKLYAVDAATGAKRWEFKTESWVESSPAVVGGVVYFGSNDGRLYALDAMTGQRVWDFRTRYPIVSSPAVADGRVYFGADDYYVYALDAERGTKLWQFKTSGPVSSSPVVANGIVYIGSGSDFAYALHALSGRLRLHFKTYYPVFSATVINDGTAYFANFNGYLYAVNGNARSWPQEHEIRPYWLQVWAFGLPLPPPPAQSGFLWGLKLGRTTTSSPVLVRDTLYIGSDNSLLAIDLEKHQRRWKFATNGAVRSTPAVSGSTIYVASEDGRLYALDALSGKKLWDISTRDKITSSPAISNGIIYVGSHDGSLYAIE